MNSTNKNILDVIALSRKLLFCADKGDIERKDDSCGVLYGVVRDCAYKILAAAQKEVDSHVSKGIWDGEEKY